MNIHYDSIKRSEGFWKWLICGYWSANKWGEREWGIRIFGLVIDNTPKGGET